MIYVQLKTEWIDLTPEVNTLWHTVIADEPDEFDVYRLYCGKGLRTVEVVTTSEIMPRYERCRDCFVGEAVKIAERIATRDYDEAVQAEKKP